MVIFDIFIFIEFARHIPTLNTCNIIYCINCENLIGISEIVEFKVCLIVFRIIQTQNNGNKHLKNNKNLNIH